MMMMAMGSLQLLQFHPLASSSSSSLPPLLRHHHPPSTTVSPLLLHYHSPPIRRRRTTTARGLVFVGKEETELRVSSDQQEDPSPEDLEYVSQIQRVLELLRKNRDMIFSEVKLTIMIEDQREVERRRLLGIEDPDAPTREDLVEALEEVEAPKKKVSKSLYAKATDTGVDPREAAKRLNMDWDSAAEIEDPDVSDETEVPPAVGYGALYLVTAFPVIIGISVVLILFYNSLQ
ncbi:ycf3-interacting protein 1, chloroplastic isoform X2 [Vitis vinifera]|uniref:ycf3-interacting protein 1, chloroplastic isoform X2 n=1 Tax=Vitis vinifera TaxID=29760 RepID=UPI00053F51C6|nr:ycf3-interacting protein 1, chloroplastic isoform X2 [Vitis vinifera]|eukprot:XP_010665471.1 PREDICTED: ycf3-interacting protein 1, chloroplastic isoform X2 [Vitis vinifera]